MTLLDNYPDVIRALAQGRADAMIDVLDFMKKHMDTHKQTKWVILETPIHRLLLLPGRQQRKPLASDVAEYGHLRNAPRRGNRCDVGKMVSRVPCCTKSSGVIGSNRRDFPRFLFEAGEPAKRKVFSRKPQA